MDRVVDSFKDSFKKSGLKVSSQEGCDFILFFCPITSRIGTDVEAAVKYLNEVNKDSKPVIIVVLHYTFDPEKIILDSNTVIMREDITAVDCLYSDMGLLACQKNTNAISKILSDSKSKKWTSFYCLNRQTMDNAVQNFKDSLKKSGLKEVSFPEQCDFILFFCPITSRTGTDIDAAVNYLNEANKALKPVSMVVLHYTFDPERIIPDSNPNINEEHISAVDCLFYDTGLLECQKNTNAISKIQTDSRSKKWTSYYCLKKDQSPSTNQDAEDHQLLHEVHEPNTRENRGIDEDHGWLQTFCSWLEIICWFCCCCCWNKERNCCSCCCCCWNKERNCCSFRCCCWNKE